MLSHAEFGTRRPSDQVNVYKLNDQHYAGPRLCPVETQLSKSGSSPSSSRGKPSVKLPRSPEPTAPGRQILDAALRGSCGDTWSPQFRPVHQRLRVPPVKGSGYHPGGDGLPPVMGGRWKEPTWIGPPRPASVIHRESTPGWNRIANRCPFSNSPGRPPLTSSLCLKCSGPALGPPAAGLVSSAMQADQGEACSCDAGNRDQGI